MQLLTGFEGPHQYRSGFVSIGNFDGVHRGHQAMLATLMSHARQHGVPAVVLTFEPHPIKLLRPEAAPPSLSTMERKVELLGKCGIDCVIAYPTDRVLLSLTPSEFFQQIIQGELEATGLVEGPNFFFGRDRQGNIDTLREFCESAAMGLEIVPPVEVDGSLVSSSKIRGLISAGELDRAIALLGHPYRIQGVVTRGEVRGRELGFPTANLVDVPALLPGDGVYAGITRYAGKPYPSAINIGGNPTFGELARKVEVHLLDFSEDVYGQILAVDVIGRIRGIKTFSGPEELAEQVEADVSQVRKVANQWMDR